MFYDCQGISMGSPISSIMAEVFLQHLEEQCIKQLLDSRNIIFYTRYLNGILLIIFKHEQNTQQALISYFNQTNAQNKIKYNI
jgi:hypothetical protein